MEQQGGGDNIKSIADWVSAVKQSPAFTQTDDQYKPELSSSSPELRLGKYRLSDLKAKDESLTLPLREKDSQGFKDEPGFLANGSDIRDVAATLRDQFHLIVNDNPTPYEFMTHIVSTQTDPNVDPSILRSIHLAETLELFLQKEADPSRQVDQQKVFTDPQYYPLFFLTLLANTILRE